MAVDGAPYTEGDFGFEIFDRDPQLNLADADDTALTVSPTNDWGSGLTQNVSFTNTSGEAIRDWQIVLDLPDGADFTVTNVWGATATRLTSGDYLFEAVSWNEEIAPGGQGRVKVTKNAITALTTFTRTTGATGTAADISLAYSPLDAPREQPLGALVPSGLGLAGDIDFPALSGRALAVQTPALSDVFDQLRTGASVGIADLFDRLDPVDSLMSGVTLPSFAVERDFALEARQWVDPSAMFFGAGATTPRWDARRLAAGSRSAAIASLETGLFPERDANVAFTNEERTGPAHWLPADGSKQTAQSGRTQVAAEAPAFAFHQNRII